MGLDLRVGFVLIDGGLAAEDEAAINAALGTDPDAVAVEVKIESRQPAGGMDMSASQRLATVRALNAKTAAPPTAKAATQAPATAPPPIEEQIDTSMTNTFEALNSRRDADNDEKDDTEDTGERPRKGFFSRFRRS